MGQSKRGIKLLRFTLDRWKVKEVMVLGIRFSPLVTSVVETTRIVVRMVIQVQASLRQTSLLSLFFKKERDWFFLAILRVYKNVSKRSTIWFLLCWSKVLYVTRTNWGNVGVSQPRNSVKAVLLQLLFSLSLRRSTQKQQS